MSTKIKPAIPFNREQRRQAEKEQRAGVAAMPEWKKAEIAAKTRKMQELSRNGITAQDLKDAYERGRKDTLMQASKMCMKFFYAGSAIVLKRDFRFGKDRILKFLTALHDVMENEIDTGEILQRAEEETGVEIRFNSDLD